MQQQVDEATTDSSHRLSEGEAKHEGDLNHVKERVRSVLKGQAARI